MKDKILDIFYNKILPQASSGKGVEIGDFWFDANIITDKEVEESSESADAVLQIRDKNSFDEALVDYTFAMIEFLAQNEKLQKSYYVYFDGNIDDIIASTTLNVWFNATAEDFRNPVSFLKTRTAFLKNFECLEELEKHHESVVKTAKKDLVFDSYVDVWNPSGNETPYVFRSSVGFLDSEDKLKLPNIAFGIDGSSCYVYAIHGEKRKDEISALQKKLNRILYQANKDVVDDYDLENIKDISVSSLVALTLFTSFIEQHGCNFMIVKGNYPVRAGAKMRNRRVSDEEFNGIYYNSINKYYRSFRRLSYHFPEIEIVSFPYEIDNSMRLKVPDALGFHDDFIHQVYKSSNMDNKSFKTR